MKLHPKGEPTHWLPCGKCLGCREIQQQQLAIRLAHQARYYDDNHFLTLTYDDDKRPDGLQKNDLQKFWKRLRQSIARGNLPITQKGLKYLACGEYGDRTQRPHYHAAILGLKIDDLKKWDSENSTSPTIDRLWGNGIVTVSELTEPRMQYVAGYVLKKAGYRKQTYCDEDGVELQAPFRDMSKGLGKEWIEAYATDLRHGYLQHNGAKHSIPRYYKDKISKNQPTLNQYIEDQKSKNWKELTSTDRECLKTGEKIREQQIKQRKRDRV